MKDVICRTLPADLPELKMIGSLLGTSRIEHRMGVKTEKKKKSSVHIYSNQDLLPGTFVENGAVMVL
jgi:hypothetical protein